MKAGKRICLWVLLVMLLLSGCAVKERREKGVFVRVADEGVISLGYYGEKNSGGVGNADGSVLAQETLRLDFKIAMDESFTLTASYEDGRQIESQAFVYNGEAMLIELTEEGFALSEF